MESLTLKHPVKIWGLALLYLKIVSREEIGCPHHKEMTKLILESKYHIVLHKYIEILCESK
jgi:hypothetical protein